jgi:hypothetical protein
VSGFSWKGGMFRINTPIGMLNQPRAIVINHWKEGKDVLVNTFSWVYGDEDEGIKGVGVRRYGVWIKGYGIGGNPIGMLNQPRAMVINHWEEGREGERVRDRDRLVGGFMVGIYIDMYTFIYVIYTYIYKYLGIDDRTNIKDDAEGKCRILHVE